MTLNAMINGPDGQFGAYVSEPANPNGTALIVIQEIFGVNEVMQSLADHFAAEGYLAIVPDLFWRIEPGINITDKTSVDIAKAFDLYFLEKSKNIIF